MKICLVGGHLTPALGVIDALGKEHSVFFVGRKYTFEGDMTESLEYILITKRGIQFIPLQTGRLQRKISFQGLQSLGKVPFGVLQSLSILRKEKPAVVITFGSYLSVPVGIAAWILRIPLVIHEQTLAAGLANKLLTPFATKICVAWEDAKRFFPAEKVVLTGNPVGSIKSEKLSLVLPGEKLPILYVTGGSAGAHAINLLLEQAIDTLLESYIVVHQTGDAKEYGDYDRLVKKRETLGDVGRKRYVLTKFMQPEEVVPMMQKASVVISRSGINTMTELLVLQKPCILIPLPHGQQNEQLSNAQYLQSVGLGEILQQDKATPDALQQLIKDMLTHEHHYRARHKDIIVGKEAAQRIVQVITDATHKRKNNQS